LEQQVGRQQQLLDALAADVQHSSASSGSGSSSSSSSGSSRGSSGGWWGGGVRQQMMQRLQQWRTRSQDLQQVRQQLPRHIHSISRV
jgi:hypothetical protein